MKIIGITNNNSASFKGLCSEKKYIKTDTLCGGAEMADFYESTYYPFINESEHEIQQAMKPKYTISSEKNIVEKFNLGEKLPFKQSEYNLYMDKTLNKKFNITLSEILKFMGEGSNKAEGSFSSVLIDGIDYIKNHLKIRNLKY